MNILFLMKYFNIGGIEVVSSVLANKLSDEGCTVTFVFFYEPKDVMVNRLDKRIKTFVLNGYVSSKSNEKKLRAILVDNNINIVINQWGLPYVPMLTLYKAKKNLNVKIISVYHTDPLANARLKRIEIIQEHTENPILNLFYSFQERIIHEVTKWSMRYVYGKSDKYLLLSQSYMANFISFTGLKCIEKVRVLTNPVTINCSGFQYDAHNKFKKILYLGRLDYSSKRIFRVIESWALLEKRFPDWSLTIVGDGPERAQVESLISKYALKNVLLEGFQKPRPYLEESSLLIMTSEYEGFPLVLAECMSFGVVPVVYGSYSAVYDIIKDGENGQIVLPQNGHFDNRTMADSLSSLMSDDEKRDQMARNAMSMVKNKFSIDIIYKQWMDLFSELSD